MKVYLFIAVVFLIFSCKPNKKDAPIDLGYDYAPATMGKYVIYDVDSTVYDDFTGDTLEVKYRIKEKLEENIRDNENRPSIRLVRYIKKYDPLISYDNIPWTIKDVWMNYRFMKIYIFVRQ